MELVGLIPAAGKASRLGKIDRSKEILEVDFQGKKQVISKFLIENYKIAGIQKICFVLRNGKWDIPDYYINGAKFGINIAYFLAQYPYGVPFTLNEALPFLKHNYVALGFPDMYVDPPDIFKVLYQKIVQSQADLILGLFPIETRSKWDMVEFNQNGKIKDIIIKPLKTELKYGWSVAVWSPVFTEFLEQKVHFLLKENEKERIEMEGQLKREIYPGDIFREFIQAGNKTDYVTFEEGKCIDLGTWEDFNKFNYGE